MVPLLHALSVALDLNGITDADFSIDKYVKEFCAAISDTVTSIAAKELTKFQVSTKKINGKNVEGDSSPVKINGLTFTKANDSNKIDVEENSSPLPSINVDLSGEGIAFKSIYSSNTIQFTQFDNEFIESETRRAFFDTIRQYERMHSLINAEQKSQVNAVRSIFDCKNILEQGKKVLEEFKTPVKNLQGPNDLKNKASTASSIQSLFTVTLAPETITVSCQKSLKLIVNCSVDNSDPGMVSLKPIIGTNSDLQPQSFMRTSFYNIVAITNSYFDYLGNMFESMCKTSN